jgi:hypothetical protein
LPLLFQFGKFLSKLRLLFPWLNYFYICSSWRRYNLKGYMYH